MTAEVKEIYDVLQARPDIKELFSLILSLPESRRAEAVALATSYLKKRGAQE